LTNTTVTNYLQALRVEEACRQLKETDKTAKGLPLKLPKKITTLFTRNATKNLSDAFH